MACAFPKIFPAIVTGSGKLRAPLPPGTPKVNGQARSEAAEKAAMLFRQHSRMFLVDSYWRVIAKDIYCAKKTMGRYFDLPFEWWNKLKVEPIGRLELNGKEIVQDF